MRGIKTFFGPILLIVLFLLGVTGCGSQEREKVVYMIHNANSIFGMLIWQEFERIAEDRGQPVEFLDAQNDVDRQISQLEDAVKKGAKIIVLSAVDEERLVPAVERALDQGVTVIALNRHLRTSKVTGVYPDEYGAGKLQAEYMERNLPMGARIVYLQGTASQLSAQERWDGFKENCLERRRDVRLMDRRDGDYSREAGRRIMAGWLEKYPHIDAVVCGNDEMALGALEALKAAGRSRGCMISGIDATEDALSAIAAGEMVQTVKQDAAHQAASVFQLVDGAQRGAMKPTDITSPFLSITKDNLSEYRTQKNR